MEMLDKIKNQIAEFDKKRSDLLSELKKEFAPMLAPLFEKHPKIKKISWCQYSPYFNDGDECVFSVRTDIDYGMKINGLSEDDEESNLDWRIKYYLKGDPSYSNLLTEKPNLDIELYKGAVEFQELIESIPEDFMKDLFGNHVEVTVTSSGDVTTEEYEHD